MDGYHKRSCSGAGGSRLGVGSKVGDDWERMKIAVITVVRRVWSVRDPVDLGEEQANRA